MKQQSPILIPLFYISILVCIATASQVMQITQNRIVSQHIFDARFCHGKPIKKWSPAKRQLCAIGIFLNNDSAEFLTYLPNIGPKRARAIVKYRQSHGPFETLNDLSRVSGIGPKTIRLIQPWIEDVPANGPNPRNPRETMTPKASR